MICQPFSLTLDGQAQTIQTLLRAFPPGAVTEIAAELSVSLNTVNMLVRNIYAKLQVRHRSSAVQRARHCC